MNKYVLIIEIILCLNFSIQASINNGFLKEKLRLEKAIEQCESQLDKIQDKKSQKQLKRKLNKLNKNYELVCLSYRETNNLLKEFRSIDPELYALVSKVVDAEGTLTNIYVKLMKRNSGKFAYYANNGFSLVGYTNIGYWKQNPNVHASEYGVYTVSVIIGNSYDKLAALAHEFAHVLYQVKNLKAYIDFFKKEYNQHQISKFGFGHDPTDPGHGFVKTIENDFRQKYITLKRDDSFASEKLVASTTDR